MLKQRSIEYIQEMLDGEIERILAALGPNQSETYSVAYDTAWVARLAPHFPGEGFEEAGNWLRTHQHQDGSWGGEILHYHDRVISTLAAIIALHEVGNTYDDEQRIHAGETFLWRENGRLNHDANDTVGFPVVAVSLVNEALESGLDVPRDLYRDVAKIEKKLNMLGHDPRAWRYTSLAFSLEALRGYLPQDMPCSDFLEANGSVATSPSATAAMLLHTGECSRDALDYLRTVMDHQGDGGVAFVRPFDILETLWSLNHLRLTGMVTPDHPDVKRVLDFVWSVWSPDNGVSFSSLFSVPDLDDTSVAFAILHWAGYPVDSRVFCNYEADDHFLCYPGEADLSLSANIRLLAALRMKPNDSRFGAWSRKIVAMLRRYDLNGYFWFDKWHISPYYLTTTAIWSLQGMMDDLLLSRVKWILKTQMADGGWGYFNRSTTEETAYCLQALLLWDERVERVPEENLDIAARYLLANLDDQAPLWIAKSVYTPRKMVSSAILTALYHYKEHQKR